LNIKRVYYPYWQWEDYQQGMWRILPKQEEQEYLNKAIEFTGNYKLYGSYMLKVLQEYPISCKQFLTNLSINRRAWIGHAACNIAINCPEYITRQAWKQLTDNQRILANLEADKAILKWELYNSKEQLCLLT
jgi:hypothetical protein